MREYLDAHLVPALMPALAACARSRPPDPLGFVAAELLKARDAKAGGGGEGE